MSSEEQECAGSGAGNEGTQLALDRRGCELGRWAGGRRGRNEEDGL